MPGKNAAQLNVMSTNEIKSRLENNSKNVYFSSKGVKGGVHGGAKFANLKIRFFVNYTSENYFFWRKKFINLLSFE